VIDAPLLLSSPRAVNNCSIICYAFLQADRAEERTALEALCNSWRSTRFLPISRRYGKKDVTTASQFSSLAGERTVTTPWKES
jgi:hypothetical protein